jgi:hypothetical protein
MDSASFNAGMMMEIGGGIRPFSFVGFQAMEMHAPQGGLAKADVDVDLGIGRVGGALIVNLVVGLEGAGAA